MWAAPGTGIPFGEEASQDDGFPIVSTNAQPKTKQKGLEAKGSQNLNEWRGKPMNLRAPIWRHAQRWTSPSYSLLLWREYGHTIAALKEIHNMSSQVILGVCLDSSFCEPPLYIWWTCLQQAYDCNALAYINAPHKSLWGWSTPKTVWNCLMLESFDLTCLKLCRWPSKPSQ